LPTSAKPRKSPTRKTTASAKKAPASSRTRIVDNTRSAAGTVAKGAAAAAAGTAVAAVAGRALISSRQPKRVLGVRMPRRRTGMKAIAKRVADIAEQVEKSSLDVSRASSQAKQAANILS
jgi:hypothetical protein